MTEFVIASVMLIAMILIGVPIAFSIGGTTLIYILMTNPGNLSAIPIRMFAGVNSFTLMALPLFMLAADLMVSTGISTKLFDFVRIRLGKRRGGLAYVNIVASTIFGSLSGAALSDMAGLGKVEIDAMTEDGYPKDFSCAITAASSIQSPLIPPSNVAILYAGVMSLSVGAILYAGFVPGILIALTQMLYVKLNSKRLNLPKHEKIYTREEKRELIKDGVIALIMPLIILVSITAGFSTPTEAAGLSVLYALLIAVIFFRNFSLKKLIDSLWTTCKSSANLFLIIAFSAVFAWAIGTEKIPDRLAEMLISITGDKYVMMLIINMILLIVGMWMETGAAVMLFAPILAPIAVAAGFNEVHFAVIMLTNLTVGLITPPVGVVLYATAEVGNEKLETVIKATMPFIILGFVVVALIVMIPEIALFVPRLFGFIS
ncbi:MAG: TRAP transporter large permease [Clostridia bacterium]|nr:TRAP transporter large permease [Clostridia bacterium]